MIERESLDRKIVDLYGQSAARALSRLSGEIPRPNYDDAPAVIEALRTCATSLLQEYEPLRMQIWAEGGATAGENMDKRIKIWGEKLETTQVALVEISRKIPSLFVKKK